MLDDLTDDERAALDDLPCDSVEHWMQGEIYDSEAKTWIRPTTPTNPPATSSQHPEEEAP